jgi:SAM-dependent methyltransferase
MDQDQNSLKASIPMPPPEFQSLVCGPHDTHLFDEVSRWLVAALNHEGMIEPGSDFLDVGCGCGRVARGLLSTSIRSYTGFDRHPGMIDWCKENLADSRFTFDFFDLKSVYTAWDNHQGATDAGEFAFPYAPESFDGCLLASVFTHMHPREVRNYLGELARIMRPGGKVLLSIFFSASGEVEAHDDGVNIFHDPDEFRADLQRTPFDARRTGHAFTPGVGFEPDTATPAMQFGYVHNWHVLTKR